MEKKEQSMEIASAEAVLPELVKRVEHGEEVVLTREGDAAARLVPLSPAEIAEDPETWDGRVYLDPKVERIEGEMRFGSRGFPTNPG